ncbi:MAG: electron transfer flavoprotein subunit alpha [marine bacterium B5-7]|nr:MAG: electron transfer flavoprotein subunit alpha [marine bacterium B5-7]
MTTLVIAEHKQQALHPATHATITAAKALQQPITVLVAGHECDAAAEQAAQCDGVSQVLLCQDARLQHPLAEDIAAIVMSVASDFSAILAPATTFGKNCLPRIAALCDVAQLSDVTQIIDTHTVQRPIYAGNVIATFKTDDELRVMSIRPTAFAACTEQAAAPIETLSSPAFTDKIAFVEEQHAESERPDLGAADIVVSGGRGLQNAENFSLLNTLADKLGAAVGATRAVVDAGFVPNDYQVGQTGKIVAPKLYFAIGISGAIQHIAGMKDSQVIVAINKDPDAPIFQVADYGIVGDLFTLVPELIEKIPQRETQPCS